MSGLNYGYSYTKRAGMFKNKTVGVIYIEKINKFIVRVYKNKTKVVTTIASFDTEKDANKFYKKYNEKI